ncbi:MAG TPA: serine/threonine-protein kinase [Ktedonobacteraceae bacterium]|nr:serine/threonine-protein kinase [Ktedonobacteraceae bacterium]
MQKVQAALQNGAIIQDRYSVVDILGRGGFSAVYLVTDQRDGKLFALKELIDQDKLERTRFTFECTVLQRLHHPALPCVESVFEENNRAYMLMNYVAGPNLEVLRKKQLDNSFSLHKVLTIMEPIIQALSYLHSQEPPIIHRDIKPSNIIVPQEDDRDSADTASEQEEKSVLGRRGKKAVLVDFGIAKEFNPDSTTTAIRHCSPGYGAPEQYALGTDLRTDIYGLGATFYSMLTGSVPVDSLQRATKLGTQGIDPLIPLRDLAPDVPEYIANAIQRAIAIAPDQRFDSVDEFLQALHGQDVPEKQNGRQSSVSPVTTTLPVTDKASSSLTASQATHSPNTDKIPAWPVLSSMRREQSSAPYMKRLGLFVQIVLALLLLLVVALGIKAYTLNAQPAQSTLPAKTTHITKPTLPTPSPSGIYPTIAPTYVGEVNDLLTNASTTMSITQVQQNGAIFKGLFNGLHETAPFNGVLDTSSHIFFTVTAVSGHSAIFFQGNVRSDSNLVGNFCDVNSGGQCINDYGLWSIAPGE